MNSNIHTILITFCCGIYTSALLCQFCNTSIYIYIYIYPCTKCGVFPSLSYTIMHIPVVLHCYNIAHLK